MLQNVLDFWDQRKDAVYSHSLRLRSLNTAERSEALSSIASFVQSSCEGLSDINLARLAFVMADDLYKAANRDTIMMDETLLQFLEASASTFLRILSERGFMLHYLVDNAFRETLHGMQRPLSVYPRWYQSSGVIYICPQHLALLMMKEKGYDEDPYFQLLPDFIGSARSIAGRFARKCHEERCHYLFLDTQSRPDSFDVPLSDDETPGSITIIRNDAPVEGSTCSVRGVDHAGNPLF